MATFTMNPSSVLAQQTQGWQQAQGWQPEQALPQAMDEALRQQCAALLQHTYRWLETAIPGAPQLSGIVAAVVTAVQLYEAQQYPACLNQITAVVSTLQQARSAFPTLPPL